MALDVDDLRRGIRWAAVSRQSGIRADAARRLVKTGYLSAMAADLVDVYAVELPKASTS